MLGARLRVAKTGVNAETGALVDMAFDSANNTPKIVREIRRTTVGSTAHGIGYTPRYLPLRELSTSPKQIGHGGFNIPTEDVTSVDGTNVNIIKEQTSPMVSVDPASLTYLFLDAYNNPTTSVGKKIRAGVPKLMLGGVDGDDDWKRTLHSYYDTPKVLYTGNLSISAPEWIAASPDPLEETRTATFTHDLGYCPLFAPFIPAQFDLGAYTSWNEQFNQEGMWSTGRKYYIGQRVYDAGFNEYRCKVNHTSSASNEPPTGGSYATYWDLYTVSAYAWSFNLDLNFAEDIKYRYGGYEGTNQYLVSFYVTTTQIVLSLYRTIYELPPFDNSPSLETNISVDYTIFSNKIDEEFNLLS